MYYKNYLKLITVCSVMRRISFNSFGSRPTIELESKRRMINLSDRELVTQVNSQHHHNMTMLDKVTNIKYLHLFPLVINGQVLANLNKSVKESFIQKRRHHHIGWGLEEERHWYAVMPFFYKVANKVTVVKSHRKPPPIGPSV